MRITSGIARAITLCAPVGDLTRPATDAARLAIFSSLGESVFDAEILDVFAGTGAYGLEALSRGAKSATFVEADPRAWKCLEKNCAAAQRAGIAAPMNILRRDAFKCAESLKGKDFDFVFADPPYAMLLEEKSLEKILLLFCDVATINTVFVLEAPAQFELPRTFNGKLLSEIKRLGKKSKGKPSQIIFKILAE